MRAFLPQHLFAKSFICLFLLQFELIREIQVVYCWFRFLHHVDAHLTKDFYVKKGKKLEQKFSHHTGSLSECIRSGCTDDEKTVVGSGSTAECDSAAGTAVGIDSVCSNLET
jgi:hypothetical protein